jgi:hypothetical protein
MNKDEPDNNGYLARAIAEGLTGRGKNASQIIVSVVEAWVEQEDIVESCVRGDWRFVVFKLCVLLWGHPGAVETRLTEAWANIYLREAFDNIRGGSDE